MKWLALPLALAACFNPKFDNPTCGPNGECPSDLTCVAGACVGTGADDASVDDMLSVTDTSIDTPPGAVCQGSGVWEVCRPSMPANAIVLASINTGTSMLCDPLADFTSATQPDACVISGSSIAVSGTVVVQGTRPLVLFATDMIVISSGAVLDVGSHKMGTTGAGAAPAVGCNAFARTPGASFDGGGGGAGGSFMSIGGNGGGGGKSNALAGLAAPVLGVPTTLRGGCNGQTGGAGILAGGVGGAGGGAVFLVAPTISLVGAITVSGAGGSGGSANAGGAGGGGSGGMIVLQATSFTGSSGGKLAANGGGGGGGAGSQMASAGGDGAVATLTVPAAGGQGSAGNGCGGNATGGTGFASTVSATTGTSGDAGGQCGGGGGGAGAGYIRANAAITGAMASPGLTIIP